MRVKRSGRVMLATTLSLLSFASLMIWHDKPTPLNSSQTQAIQMMVQNNPSLQSFLNQIDFNNGDQAFYSVGLDTGAPWPLAIEKACYPDPLAAWGQFSAIQKAYSTPVQATRYRSRADFSLLVLSLVTENPEYISSLNLNSHTAVVEKPFSISLRLLAAILAGSLSLLIVRQAKKQRNR